MSTKMCPSTRFYNELKSKFETSWTKLAKLKESKSADMDCWHGRVSKAIFKKLKKDKESREDLGRGIVRELAIIFADIRGFTKRTENMPPERIVTLLDLFIPEMTHIIMERHKGTVDKLLGDGLMAVYGHPYSSGSEPVQALYSSIDMNQAAAAMGDVLQIMGYDPIEIGIGLNTGPVLICEVGSKDYRESTVIGSPVNVAAKMEDVADAGEIVLPDNAVDRIVGLKPELEQYFAGKEENSKYGNSLYSFLWPDFLTNEGRNYGDWQVAAS